jgi:hypothetical protein
VEVVMHFLSRRVVGWTLVGCGFVVAVYVAYVIVTSDEE